MQKRKIGVILCCLLLTVTMLGACGGNNAGNSAEDETTAAAVVTTADATTAAPEEGPADPFGKMKEPTKLTAMRILTSWMGFDEGESVNDNWWTRTWKEQLDVEVEFTHIADNWGEPLDQKISVAIATDDLPDILYTYASNAAKIQKAGMIADISAAYEKYASPYIRENMSIPDNMPYKASFYEGKMFGIPSNNVYSKTTRFAWIRQDWLEKLGLQAPKTIDELEAVAKAFKDNADKLGVKSLIPISMHKSFSGTGGTDTGAAIIESFGGLASGWGMKDGKVVFNTTQPEMKAGLTKLAQWYKDGILAKDFYLKDPSTEEVEDISAGKVGIAFGSQNFPNSQGARNGLVNNHDTKWVFMPLVDAGGNLAKQYANSRITDFVVATNKCNTPEKQEALIKMVNLTAQIFKPDDKPAFIKDDRYNTGSNGVGNFWHGNTVVLQFPIDLSAEWKQAQIVAKDIEAGVDNSSTYNAYGKQIFSQMNSWKTKKFDAENFDTNWSIYEMLKVGGSQEFNQNNHDNIAVWDVIWGPETDSMIKFGSEWATKMQEYFITAVLTGEVEQNYAKWVDYWMTNGGATALTEAEEWYKANNK